MPRRAGVPPLSRSPSRAPGLRPRKQHFVFLTLPGYALLALSTAIDTLRMANRVAQHEAYEWTLASLDGKPVTASCGMTLTPTLNIEAIASASIVFVCGGLDIKRQTNPNLNLNLNATLRVLAQKHPALGALCNGAHALAKAGLLDHFKAAVHWDQLSAMREAFPRVTFSDQLFVIDRQRYTCGSGVAALHLMLEIIKTDLGRETAKAISTLFILDRIRDETDPQRAPLQARVGLFNERLLEVAALMDANVEEPLELGDIATLAGISRRQVERLFKRYVGQAPARFYLEQRLCRAQALLRQTTMTVTEIAIACGFRSTPHFSKSYRTLFGQSPSTEKDPHRGNDRRAGTSASLETHGPRRQTDHPAPIPEAIC
jgi:transcriptional regulator GlxA family with amidase domain